MWKNNNDTIITYNFTKPELTNLRLYVTNLEKISELYNIELEISLKKDSLLQAKDERLTNQDSMLLLSKSMIDYQNLEYDKINKINKDLQIKIERQTKALPYLIGGTALTSMLICLMLVK